MIQSLLRSIEILEVLKERNRSYSIAGTGGGHRSCLPALCTGSSRPSVKKKYVIRDERSHTYRLGPALIPLGKAAANGIRLQDAAHPLLSALSARSEEDSYLVIPVGNKGLCDRKDGRSQPLKVVEEFGYEDVSPLRSHPQGAPGLPVSLLY